MDGKELDSVYAGLKIDNRSDGDVVNELNCRLAQISADIETHRIRMQNIFASLAVVGCVIGAYTFGFLLFGSTNFFIVGSFCLLLAALAVWIIKKYDDRKSKLHNEVTNEIHSALTEIVKKYSSNDPSDQGENNHGG